MSIIVDYLDFKIKQRHALLARTIGTKAEEESSYTHSHNLVISATASMVALCSLEAAAYFLYNRKVSIYPRIQYNIAGSLLRLVFIALSMT